MSIQDQPQRCILPALGWACYLGSSWTWVIGMFFPILLLRDFGLWGWVVFAVPNVVGAAAMGFVLTRESSERVVERHKPAIAIFSAITFVFHFVIIAMIGTLFVGNGAELPFLMILLVFAGLIHWRSRYKLPIACMVTAASLLLFCIWHFGADSWEHVDWSLDPPRLGMEPLLLFLPASIAGFALCPYLDITFHRARQSTAPHTGRMAFVLGFGVVFLVMIVFSLSYAGAMEPLFGFFEHNPALFVPLLPVVAIHVVVQAGFTCASHLTCYPSRPRRVGTWKEAGQGAAIGLLAAAPLAVFFVPIDGISRLEAVYRSFLLFYGLVFPAYVFLCMIPTWREVVLSRKRLVFAVATVIALPMGFAGFVIGVSWWIPASLGVLVVARGVIEVMGRGRAA